MKKAIWMIIFLVAMLSITVSSMADEITTYRIGNADTKHRSIHSVEKGIILRPSRGTTLNLFTFGDCDSWASSGDLIDMRSGKVVDSIIFSCYGVPKFTVESGSKWLEAYYDEIYVAENYNRTKSRNGSIVVTDNRGVVMRIKITQSSDVRIISVKQLNGGAHDREVRIQTSRIQGATGKVIYYEKGDDIDDIGSFWYEEDVRPVKYTKGVIWFHKNRPVNNEMYYNVGLYRVIAGRRHLSYFWENPEKYITLTH